ncbi:hypothetical protein [Rothia nasimurium]|nr:hypothetical protein [Rothia nasimurium]
MLAMTDSLQTFIDAQVNNTTEETAWFINRQISRFIAKDPTGTTAETIINRWYDSTEPTETDDIIRLKFASHVIKALTIQRYIKESKTSSYWALVTMYDQGTRWQQQTASGEIAYRISKIAGEKKLEEWIDNMSTLTTKAEEMDYLNNAINLFPDLAN